MKKILLRVLTILIISSAITGNLKAQMFLTSVSGTKGKGIYTSQAYAKNEIYKADEKNISGDEKSTVNKNRLNETKANLKAIKANLRAMKANFKASENFKKEFKDAADVRWEIENEMITAAFNRDSIQTYVVYNKKGSWMHTLAYYNENRIPAGIRNLIRNFYPDFSITGMSEINESNITFNIVYLESATRYKQISVYDGNTEVYKEFSKQ